MSLKPTKKTNLNKEWYRSRDDSPFKRNLKPEYHLIVTEGTKTEPKYFEALKESMNMVYRIISLFFGFGHAFALIPWFVKPFVYVRGTFTAGDDTTRFLYNFSQGHSPILVSIAAALLFGISIFLVIRKRVLRNFIEEIKRTCEAVKRER